MKKIKLGLIGCGRISKNHFDAVSQFPDAEFVAVADIIPEKAQTMADQYNIPGVYQDYQEMLRKEELDAVSICTPSGSHPQIGIDVAKAKAAVITEKPMAITIEQADRLIRTCDDNNVPLFVV